MTQEQILLPTSLYQSFGIVRKGSNITLTSSDVEEIECYLKDVETGLKVAQWTLSDNEIELVSGSTSIWFFWIISTIFEVGKTYKLSYTVTTKEVTVSPDLEVISGYFDREIYVIGNAEPNEPTP
jgi:hypothetical protein